MSCPIDQFLTGHKVDIGQSQDRVQKLEETFLAVRPLEEPGRVEEEGEGSFGFGVVLQKILGENLLDGGRVLFVVTAVGHGAGAAAHVFDGGHRDFPHAYNTSIRLNMFTVLENHRKSLIQHCERSELRLHFEWTKVD